jgi:biotin transport system substrate-specific component
MRLAKSAAAVLVFAALIALGARLAVPMVPVPMTMQTFAVLLAGAALGAWRGAAAVLLYLAAAATGLPVLSDGASGLASFAGPTAGYLLAFPLGAAVVGWASASGRLERPVEGFVLLCAAHLLILGLGTAWLATRIGPAEALAAGFTPFLIGAAVKSALVLLAERPLRRLKL